MYYSYVPKNEDSQDDLSDIIAAVDSENESPKANGFGHDLQIPGIPGRGAVQNGSTRRRGNRRFSTVQRKLSTWSVSEYLCHIMPRFPLWTAIQADVISTSCFQHTEIMMLMLCYYAYLLADVSPMKYVFKWLKRTKKNVTSG